MSSLVLAVIVVVLVIGIYLAAKILSSVKFRKPTGPYAPATQGVEVTDHSRIEDAVPGQSRSRKLILQFWYPAMDTGNNQKANYHPNPREFNSDVAGLFKAIPQIFLKRLSGATTNSLVNAPLSGSEKKYPVLIFSHGMDGMRFLNTFQMEELASHGYIVVSIEHTFSATGTVFQDGTKAGVTPYELMENDAFADEMVNKWSADQVFAINYLQTINQSADHVFFNKLDLDKLGVFGFSFGGAVSTNTLVLDKRIKAGINLDGFYYGMNYSKGFEQPFMEIRSQPATPEKVTNKELELYHLTRERWKYVWFDEWNKRRNAYAKNGYYSYTISGSNHFSFCDLPLIAPFPRLLSPRAGRIHELTNEYTLAFFDQHLKGRKREILAEPIKVLE